MRKRLQFRTNSIPKLTGLLTYPSKLSGSVRTTNATSTPSLAHAMAHSSAGTGQALDSGTRAFMESRFGHDFSNVRIHADHQAAQSADAVNARAFTVGQDVVFDHRQYAPTTSAGRQLLAHELTHVVQQGAASEYPMASSSALAEQEAHQISGRVAAGLAGSVSMRSAPGTLQREEKSKPKGKFDVSRGFRQEPEKVKNSFGFTAELKVPLVPGVSFGAVTLLDSLKLETKGGKESEEPIGISETELDFMRAKLALDLAKLEILKLKGLPGELSLTSGLEASGSLQQPFGEGSKFSSGLGAKASLDAAFKTSPFPLGRFGNVGVESKLGASAGLEQAFGTEDKSSAKLGTKASLGAKFTSRPLRSPLATFGGFLGDKATLSLGADTSFSAGVDAEGEKSSKVTAGGSLGLTGTGAGAKERFVKVKVSGEAKLDLGSGKLEPGSSATVVGVSAGFKF